MHLRNQVHVQTIGAEPNIEGTATQEPAFGLPARWIMPVKRFRELDPWGSRSLGFGGRKVSEKLGANIVRLLARVCGCDPFFGGVRVCVR